MNRPVIHKMMKQKQNLNQQNSKETETPSKFKILYFGPVFYCLPERKSILECVPWKHVVGMSLGGGYKRNVQDLGLLQWTKNSRNIKLLYKGETRNYSVFKIAGVWNSRILTCFRPLLRSNLSSFCLSLLWGSSLTLKLSANPEITKTGYFSCIIPGVLITSCLA